MLYVQALLLGHHPLNAKEMAILNDGLLALIEWGIDTNERGDLSATAARRSTGCWPPPAQEHGPRRWNWPRRRCTWRTPTTT